MPTTTASPPLPHRKLRWCQFSVKTLVLFVLLLSLLISWLGVKMRAVQKQRRSVDAVENVGGFVSYDYQLQEYDDDKGPPPPPGPAWLRRLFGDDIFANVVHVDCINCKESEVVVRALDGLPHVQRLNLAGSNLTDDDLRHLVGLKELYGLDLSRTTVSDGGLVHLQGLVNLSWLVLSGTKVTDVGVARLRKELRYTRIRR
jgi:hypothetical protein